MYPFNEIGIGLWALSIAMGLAMVAFWGIISWAVVTILRYLDARERRVSQEPLNSDSETIQNSPKTIWRTAVSARGGSPCVVARPGVR